MEKLVLKKRCNFYKEATNAQPHFVSGPTPRIVLENIGGDSTSTGWERPEFRVTHGEEVELRVEGDTIFVRCDDDCRGHAPRGATIEVFSIGGDAVIHAVSNT